jgi:hypothetical protein
MHEIMVNVYYKLIKAGSKTIDQVPPELKDDVQLLLNKES